MGETAADYLAVNLGLGLAATWLIISALLIAALMVQFAQRRYVPWSDWLAVVLISIVGTLVTDNLVDNFGVVLTTAIAFSLLLGAVFAVWYIVEGALSIHTICNTRREAFYWLAILFAFALGTFVGDLVAEKFSLGYLATGVLFGAFIAVAAVDYFRFGLGEILGFWLAYIPTRPLGISFGDLLSQPVDDGGPGFGTIVTGALFLAAIVALVLFMTPSGRGSNPRSASSTDNLPTSLGRPRRAPAVRPTLVGGLWICPAIWARSRRFTSPSSWTAMVAGPRPGV